MSGGNNGPAESALVALEKSRKSALPLALVFWVLSIAGTAAQAQETLPQLVQIAQAESQATAMIRPSLQRKSCEIWDDESISVNQDDRTEALRRLNSLLSEFMAALQCERVRIGHFTDQGRFARFSEFEVPQPLRRSIVPRR